MPRPHSVATKQQRPGNLLCHIQQYRSVQAPCSSPLQILHLLVKATMHIVHADGKGPCHTPHNIQLTCNSPPQIPHSRADTASLRPVPMVATIRSPATSAQSRPRTPNCRACRRGLGFVYGKLPQTAELLCKGSQR